MLSALSYGNDPDVGKAVQIALAAMAGSIDLDADRSVLYVDLVRHALSEAARKALQAMKPENYEFQSEFARRYVAQGKEEGLVAGVLQGKADLVAKQLTLKFGALPAEVTRRIAAANITELDVMAERVLSATSVQDVIDPAH